MITRPSHASCMPCKCHFHVAVKLPVALPVTHRYVHVAWPLRGRCRLGEGTLEKNVEEDSVRLPQPDEGFAYYIGQPVELRPANVRRAPRNVT